jgi:hypothetical protein
LTFKENIPIIAEKIQGITEKNCLKKIFQLLQKKIQGITEKNQDNTKKKHFRKYSGYYR